MKILPNCHWILLWLYYKALLPVCTTLSVYMASRFLLINHELSFFPLLMACNEFELRCFHKGQCKHNASRHNWYLGKLAHFFTADPYDKASGCCFKWTKWDQLTLYPLLQFLAMQDFFDFPYTKCSWQRHLAPDWRDFVNGWSSLCCHFELSVGRACTFDWLYLTWKSL